MSQARKEDLGRRMRVNWSEVSKPSQQEHLAKMVGYIDINNKDLDQVLHKCGIKIEPKEIANKVNSFENFTQYNDDLNSEVASNMQGLGMSRRDMDNMTHNKTKRTTINSIKDSSNRYNPIDNISVTGTAMTSNDVRSMTKSRRQFIKSEQVIFFIGLITLLQNLDPVDKLMRNLKTFKERESVDYKPIVSYKNMSYKSLYCKNLEDYYIENKIKKRNFHIKRTNLSADVNDLLQIDAQPEDPEGKPHRQETCYSREIYNRDRDERKQQKTRTSFTTHHKDRHFSKDIVIGKVQDHELDGKVHKSQVDSAHRRLSKRSILVNNSSYYLKNSQQVKDLVASNHQDFSTILEDPIKEHDKTLLSNKQRNSHGDSSILLKGNILGENINMISNFIPPGDIQSQKQENLTIKKKEGVSGYSTPLTQDKSSTKFH